MPVTGEHIPLGGDDVGALVLRTGRAARIDNHDNAAGPESERVQARGRLQREAKRLPRHMGVVERCQNHERQRAGGRPQPGETRSGPVPPPCDHDVAGGDHRDDHRVERATQERETEQRAATAEQVEELVTQLGELLSDEALV